MQFLAMLVPLLALVSFAAYVWLVVVAFRRSVGWGLLVLFFSPISAIVFAVKFWPEPKKPFLVFVGSFSAYCTVLLMFVVFLGGSMFKMAQEMSETASKEGGSGLMEAREDRTDTGGPMSEKNEGRTAPGRHALRPQAEQEPEVDPDADAFEAVPDEALSMAEPEDLPRTQPQPEPAVPLDRDVVALREIGDHVGEKLQVTLRNGNDFLGRLVDQDGTTLEFEQRISSGTMTVYVDRNEIRSVKRLKNR